MLLLAACTGLPPPSSVPLTGSWGGEHVGLRLTETGGVLDYDCAAGRIDGPIIPRADGSFEAEGAHTPGTGGPEQIGVVPPSFAASYNGQASGDRLTFEAKLESGVTIGPFALRRGAEPQIFRCL